MRALSAFGERVARLEPVRAPAQFRGDPRGELVAGREEHLGAEALQQRPPRFVAAERRSQRRDALRRDDRDQPRLARQRERALVAGRVGFARPWQRRGTRRRRRGCRATTRCGSAAIFGMRCRTARWKSSFSITPRPRASAGFMATGKFRPSTCPVSSRSSSGGRGRGSPGFGGVMYASRGGQNARCTAGVFVEQRQEHDDAFDDGRLDLRVEPRPRVVEPPLDRLEPVAAVRADRGRARAHFERNVVSAR